MARLSAQERNSITEASESVNFVGGIALFNSGEFFRAHEAWEEIWLTSSGRDKTFLQGLIQLAAAFHHQSRGNISGASSLLRASCAKLAQLPNEYWGIKLSGLRKSLHHWLETLNERKLAAQKGTPRIEFNGKSGSFGNQSPRRDVTDRRSARPSSPNARNRRRRST